MADEYDGLDEAVLRNMLEDASDYTKRSGLRKAIRRLKGGADKGTKSKGSASYRRPGFQAPKSHTIPNSVTGNVLPDKVNLDNIAKVEKPQTGPTTSYLSASRGSVSSAAGPTGRGRSSPRGSTSASPRGSVSSQVSSTTPEPKHFEEPEEHSRVNGGQRESRREPSPEPARQPSPAPVREPTPEPIREPTPVPVREPTPEPPREPTPEPVREPTPEPPREPTPEPVREPTPEPPREPTPEPEPEPVREPTPEPEPEPVREPTPEPVQVEEPDTTPVCEGKIRSPTPSDEEEEEEDDDEEEDEEEEEEEVEADSRYDYRSGRSVGDKNLAAAPEAKSVPMDVLNVREEGVDDGDFRRKLRKAEDTKINTAAAFPQAKPKGEQVDFRNLLRRSDGPERKQIRTGSSAQTDFRGSLKRSPKKEPAQLPVTPPKPSPKPSPRPSRRREEEEEEVRPGQQEEAEEEDPQPVEPEQEDEEGADKEEVDAAAEPEKEEEELSYEERQAERRKRREQRQRELDEMGAGEEEEEEEEGGEKPTPNGGPTPNGAPTPNGGLTQNGTTTETKKEAAAEDSYEARREARRKAREERLKAAASQIDEKPTRLSYRERKAREQLQNAKDNRKKWSNREDESGEKTDQPASFKKNKDSATQQLLAWCQHKTKYYENVEIKDFRTSWSNGLAFCAIMHSFLPDKIPYDDLSAENPRHNFTIAFDAAQEAGIPEMLDVDDMVNVRIPDAKSIMTFLVTIYQHFNS